MGNMGKREIVKADEFEDWLDETSRNIVEDFLSGYKKKDNYSSAIRILLYHDVIKDDVTDLTFDDYMKVIPQNKKKLNSQESYKKRFFQYLYALDHLKQPFGFDSIMHKQTLIKEFSEEKNEKPKITDKKEKNPLTVEELLAIQNVLNADSTKLDTLKMQFCWFALFELGLPIEEVRKEITSENYNNGRITTSEGKLEIPYKFHQMFIDLSKKKESNYNGFATLDTLIANLGRVAKLSRKLLPNMVKNARRTTKITCRNCFIEFSNESQNWTSINNRIVCVECADTIKKKLNFEVEQQDIENTDIDTTSNQEMSLLFTYNELKTKLKNKKVDYLKLHEFQIEIGKLGEAFAYEVECTNLKGTKYFQLIDQSKADNPSNGYDILSFTKDGHPLHIEVKATVGKEEKFYLSENERETALEMEKQGLMYVVYFIKEIMSDNPQLEVITNVTSNEEYVFTAKSWEVSKIEYMHDKR